MKIVVDSQLVNYADEGKGDVILLLHGWGANLKTFDGMAKELTQKYRVIRLDFPGFGESSMPPQNWELHNYAQLVIAFLQKLKITHIHAAITHSFGGRVIIKLVGENLLQPDKIVLIDAGGISRSASLRNQTFKAIAKTGKQIVKLPVLRQFHATLRQRLYKSAGSTDYIEAGELQRIFLRLIREDVRHLAAKITQPTLILWGHDDTVTPLADAKIYEQQIQDSTLVVFPDAGHFAYLDQPQKVMTAVKAFL